MMWCGCQHHWASSYGPTVKLFWPAPGMHEYLESQKLSITSQMFALVPCLWCSPVGKAFCQAWSTPGACLSTVEVQMSHLQPRTPNQQLIQKLQVSRMIRMDVKWRCVEDPTSKGGQMKELQWFQEFQHAEFCQSANKCMGKILVYRPQSLNRV